MCENISPFTLAKDVIERFEKPNKHTGFEYLIEARSGLGLYSYGRIKFCSQCCNENTEELMEKLADVFESVYGIRPSVTVYTPHSTLK